MRAVAVFIFAACTILVQAQTDSSPRISVPVEHSFNGKDWSSRGTISFRAPSSFLTSDPEKLSKSVSFSQNSISKAEKEALQASEYYRIRLSNENYVSVPACALIASNLEDSIIVNVEDDKVVSLSYSPKTASCGKKSSQNSLSSSFNTQTLVRVPVEGPKPKMDFAKPPEVLQPKEEQQSGSFISKYWYYLAPLGIVAFISMCVGGSDDEGGQQQSGAGQRPAAKATATRR